MKERAKPAKRFGVRPIMINNWKRAFVKGDRFIEVFGGGASGGA